MLQLRWPLLFTKPTVVFAVVTSAAADAGSIRSSSRVAVAIISYYYFCSITRGRRSSFVVLRFVGRSDSRSKGAI